MSRVKAADLDVDEDLHAFVETEVLPGSGVASEAFWSGFAAIVRDLAPRNRQLLLVRDALQAEIDAYHREGKPATGDAYVAFLRQIGYLLPPAADALVTTSDVDDEIATLAGPQLVVPMSNARYTLNAANARWGSLYDALYGTDAIPDEGEAARGGKGYNPARGALVVGKAKALLDEVAPLEQGSHEAVIGYSVVGGALKADLAKGMAPVGLRNTAAFVGYRGAAPTPESVLLVHTGLHLDLVIDRASPIGRTDPAGLSDVVLESALTTIVDMEDSVSAVDAEDKIAIYRNWLGLMDGTLSARFPKGGSTVVRNAQPRPRSTRRPGRQAS